MSNHFKLVSNHFKLVPDHFKLVCVHIVLFNRGGVSPSSPPFHTPSPDPLDAESAERRVPRVARESHESRTARFVGYPVPAHRTSLTNSDPSKDNSEIGVRFESVG